jgi:hypothetical protein
VPTVHDAVEDDARDGWVEANLGWLAPAMPECALHELCIAPA